MWPENIVFDILCSGRLKCQMKTESCWRSLHTFCVARKSIDTLQFETNWSMHFLPWQTLSLFVKPHADCHLLFFPATVLFCGNFMSESVISFSGVRILEGPATLEMQASRRTWNWFWETVALSINNRKRWSRIGLMLLSDYNIYNIVSEYTFPEFKEYDMWKRIIGNAFHGTNTREGVCHYD